jgi:hypothetical protein
MARRRHVVAVCADAEPGRPSRWWGRIEINIVSTVSFINDLPFIVSIVSIITSNTSILSQSGGCWEHHHQQ